MYLYCFRISYVSQTKINKNHELMHISKCVLGVLSSKYASSNLSRSSLSSGSISQNNILGGMQNNGLPNSPTMMDDMLSPPARDAPLYERLKWSHEFDEMSHRDVALGRRIGFYKIKSDLGSGNFSKVKLANHQLTKGKSIFQNLSLCWSSFATFSYHDL